MTPGFLFSWVLAVCGSVMVIAAAVTFTIGCFKLSQQTLTGNQN